MTTVFHAEPGITLYCGDCRELLPHITADVLVMDPPYGLAYRSNGGGTVARDAAGWSLGRAIENDGDTALRDEVLTWWGDDKPALVFGSWKVARPRGTRTVLIYDKGGAAGMGDLTLPWKPSHEEIYVLGRGFVGSRDTGSVIPGRVPVLAKLGRAHPTEKDARTMQRLLAKCPPGLVLDPFCGVGPVLLAAKTMGRPAIGIEIDPRYCAVAVERLRQGVLAL